MAEQGDNKAKQGVPPEASRWKPGQSGNPAGRPKERPIAAELKRLADEKITLKVDGREVTMTRLEALAMQAWGKAMKGDFRWGKEVWDRIDGKVADSLDLTSGGEPLGGGFADLSPAEQAAAVKELAETGE